MTITAEPSLGILDIQLEGNSDSDLLQAIIETRDREAFAAFFSRFAPRVKAYLMQQGIVSAEAENLAIETMLVLWRSAQLFSPTEVSVSTSVFKVARNLCVEAVSQHRRPELDPSDAILERDRK